MCVQKGEWVQRVCVCAERGGCRGGLCAEGNTPWRNGWAARCTHSQANLPEEDQGPGMVRDAGQERGARDGEKQGKREGPGMERAYQRGGPGTRDGERHSSRWGMGRRDQGWWRFDHVVAGTGGEL